MEKNSLKIADIPSIIWGAKSEKVYIAVHGDQSHKEDEIIKLLAAKAISKGYQVISFDLPEHGSRKGEATLCKVENCLNDLEKIMIYAKESWSEINLFACSIGAYFSLLAYKDEAIKKALFLSPVVDMKVIIENMMQWFNISKDQLKKEQEIITSINKTLYWDYYCYVLENPIIKWNTTTSILYAEHDDIVNYETIKSFCDNFNCDLTIVKDAVHFFHLKEDLNKFKEWLSNKIN